MLALTECQSYVTFTAINRSANNDKPGSLCDDKLPRGWYRFAGPAGNMMPTTCVPVRHCGTHAPGWFSGPHPAVHEGAVRRDVCFHWRSCCSWRNSVLVRNCGAFYVYYLSPTVTCNLGYCGNGQGMVSTRFCSCYFTSPTIKESLLTVMISLHAIFQCQQLRLLQVLLQQLSQVRGQLRSHSDSSK